MNIDRLIDEHVERAISTALQIVRNVDTRQARLTVRYRSSSHHRPERKFPFYHTIPRCSLPSTKNDLIYYHSRVSSAAKLVRHRPSVDVQYSFSLQKSSPNRIHHQFIEHYAEDLSVQTIRSALGQIGHDPSNVTEYVDQLLEQTIQSAIEQISRRTIEHFIDQFVEDLFNDALSIIADHQISARALPIDRSTDNENPVQHVVDTVAERIFLNSLEFLREYVSLLSSIVIASFSQFRIFLNEQQWTE